jgi:glucans biosynthesis protein
LRVPKAELARRTLLRGGAAGLLALLLSGRINIAEAEEAGLNFGPPKPFDFEALIERARDMATRPYVPPYQPMPEVVSNINYEVHGKIRFDADNALFATGAGAYPVTFFHLGMFFPKAVKMHAVDAEGAREVLYSADYFEMPEDSIARQLPADSGFAGFKLHESRAREDWKTQDWIAFLGASYFRAIGELNQYGLSARGIALDVAAPTPEEFPDFIEFYIEPAASDVDPVVISALLDGPGITGAYRFTLRRTEAVITDVEQTIFLRRDIYRLGIAPMTSMFWYSEYNRRFREDWRPEVHDSDGLAIWTGSGERLWRPLNNPKRVITSSFVDDDFGGFGLLQRDRDFENYLDGVHYDKRPSLWCEPLGPWGEGAVQLVEIPTNDEIHDNIVAFWVPKEPAVAGNSYSFKYRLHWLAEEPYPAENVAATVATRIGRGGQPGQPRPEGVTKFMLEFAGVALEAISEGDEPEPVITASRGEISYVFAEPVPDDSGRWRVQFDLTADGVEPVEMRVYLNLNNQPLTETWLYQFHPEVSA